MKQFVVWIFLKQKLKLEAYVYHKSPVKLSDCRERSKQCENRTKFDALYDFSRMYKSTFLRFLVFEKNSIVVLVLLSTRCQTAEKSTRWPFLCPEGVQRYSERAKKGQNNAKIVQSSMLCTIFHVCTSLNFFVFLFLKIALLFLCFYRQSDWSLTASVLFYSHKTVRRTITLCKAQ